MKLKEMTIGSLITHGVFLVGAWHIGRLVASFLRGLL